MRDRARARHRRCSGIDGAVVEIEADISTQLPTFVLIGLPDAALGEARDRVRSAAGNSGMPLPVAQADRQPLARRRCPSTARASTSASRWRRSPPTGRSSADVGRARRAPGRAGARRSAAADRRHPARGARRGARGLRHRGGAGRQRRRGRARARRARGRGRLAARRRDLARRRARADRRSSRCCRRRSAPPLDEPGDLADVIGNPDAVEAMQVAAAGGHHVFLLGPPGAGKTMLASRLPGLLPDLDRGAGARGELDPLARRACRSARRLATRPPLEAPHHTASAAAIVGGGSGLIRPGAAARAAHGVLFLDEAPEFAPAVARRAAPAARVGRHHDLAGERRPRASRPGSSWCSPRTRARAASAASRDARLHAARRSRGGATSARLSGPLLDRVDIQLRVHRITAAQLRMPPSATAARHGGRARARSLAARATAADRLRATRRGGSTRTCRAAWLRSPAGAPLPRRDRRPRPRARARRHHHARLRPRAPAGVDARRPRRHRRAPTPTTSAGRSTCERRAAMSDRSAWRRRQFAPLIRAAAPASGARPRRRRGAFRAGRLDAPSPSRATGTPGAWSRALGRRAARAAQRARGRAPTPTRSPAELADAAAGERRADATLGRGAQALAAARRSRRRRAARAAPGRAVRRCGCSSRATTHWPTGVDELGDARAARPVGARRPCARSRRLERSIALVGARAATGYGEHVTVEASQRPGRSRLRDRVGRRLRHRRHRRTARRSRAAARRSPFWPAGSTASIPSGHEALLTRIVERGVVVVRGAAAARRRRSGGSCSATG